MLYKEHDGNIGNCIGADGCQCVGIDQFPISEISQAQAAIHGAGYIQHHSIHSCQKIMPHPLIWHFHVLIITMDPYLHKDPGLNSDQKHTCQKPDQAFILFIIIHLKLLPFYLVFNLCTVYH